MVVKLIFSINRELYTITVDGKYSFYSDRKLKTPVRVIPPDERIQIKISRNIIPKERLGEIEMTPEEREEYSACINEDDIAKLWEKSVKSNGSVLLKKEVIKNET